MASVLLASPQTSALTRDVRDQKLEVESADVAVQARMLSRVLKRLVLIWWISGT
jgi:hypothetical protein